MKKNLLFVINPVAGGREKKQIHRLIDRKLDHSLFEHEFAYTESVDHARRLSKSAAYLGFDVVAAVGGDGTVNEVARGILEMQPESRAALAIIPFGSGNGLARHLKIPVKPAAALGILNRMNVSRMDTGLMNGRPFFCAAGTGFDAHISHEFARSEKRGFAGYIKAALQELRSYKPREYMVRVGETQLRERAFLISVANASQYGNNARIAPAADTSDGLLDVCVLRAFPFHRFPEMAFRLMSGSIGRSSYMRILKGSDIVIEREGDDPVHLDGEPGQMGKRLEIGVVPLSLPVLVP